MLPDMVLSTTPEPSAFLPPRTVLRASAVSGLSDFHYGGIHLNDATHGITYQLWTLRIAGNGILLSAPNTSEFQELTANAPTWGALAFDQNARVFIAYVDVTRTGFYYWFDSTIPGYRLSQLPGNIDRVFASLDDSRVPELQTSDVILSYVREGVLYFRAQRDRFGVEYTLGSPPAPQVQVGMSHGDRYQFAFEAGT